MVRRQLQLAILAISLCFSAIPTWAQSTNRVTITGTISEFHLPRGTKNYFDFKAKYQLQMWTLMGEPVFQCNVKWNFNDSGLAIKFMSEKYGMDKASLAEIGAKPKLYNLKFYVPLSNFTDWVKAPDPFYNRFVLCNGDAMGNAGKNNFSTPGSPSWAKTIHQNDNVYPNHFLPAAEAKKVFKQLIDINKSRSPADRKQMRQTGNEIVIKASFNLQPYYTWVAKKAAAQKKPSSKEDDFWNGGDDPDANGTSLSKEDDFWNGGEDPNGPDPTDFEIKTVGSKQGVSTTSGRVLIPFREWNIKSYESGLAKVTMKQKRERSTSCKYSPPDGRKGGGWGYQIIFSAEGFVNSLGEWAVPPKKFARGMLVKYPGIIRDQNGKYAKYNRCKSQKERDLRSALNKYQSEGYTISLRSKPWIER